MLRRRPILLAVDSTAGDDGLRNSATIFKHACATDIHLESAWTAAEAVQRRAGWRI